MKPQSTKKEKLTLIERDDIFNLGHSDPRARSSTKVKEAEDLSFLLDEEVLARDKDGEAPAKVDMEERLKARVASNMKAFLVGGQGKQIQALMEEVPEPEQDEEDQQQPKLFSPAVDAEQSLHEVVQELNQKKTETLNRTIIHKCCLEQNFAILELHLGRFQNTTEAAERQREEQQQSWTNVNSKISDSNNQFGGNSFLDKHKYEQEIISRLVNDVDIYGNNALQLACIYPIYQRCHHIPAKQRIVELLLDHGANPNVRNYHTGFTALHWAARNGELQIVKLLCEHSKEKHLQAIEYIPDEFGNLPLDYAGVFYKDDVKKMTDVMLYLIKRMWRNCKNKINFIYDNKKEGLESIHKQHAIVNDDKSNGDHFPHFCQEFLINPITRSTVLYWACQLPESVLSWYDVKRIYLDLQAYPECPNLIEAGKTSFHKAAIQGNFKKLTILCQSLNERFFGHGQHCSSTHSDNHRPAKGQSQKVQHGQVTEDEIKPPFFDKDRADQFIHSLSVSGKYEKFQQRLVRFLAQQEKNEQLAKDYEFDSNFQDDEGLTPLHYACQFNNPACTKILLLDNGANCDISSKAGVRPRDTIQYPDIKGIFQEYYLKIDAAISDKEVIKGKLNKSSDVFSLATADPKALIEEVSKHQHALQPTMADIDLDSDVEQDQEEVDVEYQLNKLSNRICYRNVLQHYSLHWKKDINIINKILKNRHELPEFSQLALKINFSKTKESKGILDKLTPGFITDLTARKKVDPNKKRKINQMIMSLVNEGFIVRMFPSVADPDFTYFLLLEMTQTTLESKAEKQGYEQKLLHINLKICYRNEWKGRFEPFRTKDINQIYLNCIMKCIPFDDLEDEQIIQQYFQVHDMNAASDTLQKISNTSICQILRQNFCDHKKQEYKGVTALKNYFGEKFGFQYAFIYFYTTWLSIPAIGGCCCLIYQVLSGRWITPTSFFYSIVISIWMTIFSERWKRKENEYSYYWGTSLLNRLSEKNIRKEFKGNERFDFSDFKINRKNQSKAIYILRLINILIMIIFITICLATFYVCKQLSGKWLNYAGVINAICIEITNTLYRITARPLVKLENWKYEEEYYSSFAQKIFFFQFINANISVLWAIFEYSGIQTDREKKLQELNMLLLGMVVSKIVAMFSSRVGTKFIIYQIKKYLYFKKCNALAIQQQDRLFRTHNNDNQPKSQMKMNKQQDQLHEEYQEMQKKRKEFEIFRHLKLKKPQNLEYRRLISTFGNREESSIIEKEQYMTDQIELNSLMDPREIEYELQEFSATFVLLSYVSLYSFICPFVSCLIFVNNILSMRFERYVHLKCIRRRPMFAMNNLGYFNTVVEILSQLTVFMNCLFLFWFRYDFQIYITDTLQFLSWCFPSMASSKDLPELLDLPAIVTKLHQQTGKDFNIKNTDLASAIDKNETENSLLLKFLIIVIILEHVIVILKFSIEKYIPDTPYWVERCLASVQHTKEKMEIEHAALITQKKLDSHAAQIVNQKKSFLDIVEKITTKHKQIQQEYQQMRSTQHQREEERQKVGDINSAENKKAGIKGIGSRSNDSSTLSSIENQRQSKQSSGLASFLPSINPISRVVQIKGQKPTLTSFFEDRFGWSSQGLQVPSGKVEHLFHNQMQVRLFRNTYHIIENHILQNRLGLLAKTKRFLIINCCQCQIKLADIQCHDCENDFFCQDCFQSNHVRQMKNHKTTDTKQYSEKMNIKPSYARINSLLEDADAKKKSAKVHKWQKFEKFNFPLVESNEIFDQLRYYFNFIKDSYININNIQQSGQVDMVKMIFDQNYGLIGQKMEKKIVEHFKDERQNREMTGINDFEIDQHLDLAAWSRKTGSKGGIQTSSLLDQKFSEHTFNDEELLFLNRVAFLCLSEEKVNLSFATFIDKLKILQEGTLSEKMDMVFEILQKGRHKQEVIQIGDFIKFIMSSIPQDIDHTDQADELILNLFGGNQISESTIIQIDEFKAKLQKLSPGLLECVLQVDEQSDE